RNEAFVALACVRTHGFIMHACTPFRASNQLVVGKKL
ncbi:unnamed protein product, partial [Heterotrigona itama]